MELNQSVIVEKLRTVYDPEIPVNIYDLGLIYHINIIVQDIYIVMTLTTASCPAAAFLPEEVKNVLHEIPGAARVHVDIVYEPQWTSDKMSTEARKLLGFS